CTEEACTRAPGCREVPDGLCGGTNSTDFAPKIVLLAILTAAFDGMYRIWPLSIASVNRASLSLYWMSETLPIWIPRYLTFASLSITRPARGEVTVTESVDV